MAFRRIQNFCLFGLMYNLKLLLLLFSFFFLTIFPTKAIFFGLPRNATFTYSCYKQVTWFMVKQSVYYWRTWGSNLQSLQIFVSENIITVVLVGPDFLRRPANTNQPQTASSTNILLTCTTNSLLLTLLCTPPAAHQPNSHFTPDRFWKKTDLSYLHHKNALQEIPKRSNHLLCFN